MIRFNSARVTFEFSSTAVISLVSKFLVPSLLSFKTESTEYASETHPGKLLTLS